ncbi:MAG: cupin domain-containing protein [Pseudomonadota bacterium]
MPVIDLSEVEVFTGSGYPAPHAEAMGDRSFQPLGDHAGLTQYGVVLVTMNPGSTSSLRHWHKEQDEFTMITEGELILCENDGETPVRTGDCIAWPKNTDNGHCLKNRSDAVAKFLVIGTRTPTDHVVYSDVDLEYHEEGEAYRFTKRGGAPLDETES